MALLLMEHIEVVKVKLRGYLDTLYSNYSKPTLALGFVFFLVVGVKWIREISWRLMLAPFVILSCCIFISLCLNVFYSESFKDVISNKIIPLVNKVIPPHISGKVVSFFSFIWWRLRIGLQTSFKKVVNSEALRRNQFLQTALQQSNSRSVFICIILLLLYSGTSIIFAHQSGSSFNESGHSVNHISQVENSPSIAKPFIFLHVPGSGGVSYRKAIYTGATSLRANKFLPCFDGVKCAVNTDQEFNKTFIRAVSRASQLTITQREMRCAAVIGGHFKMSFLGVLAALDQVNSRDACPSRHWTLSPYSAPQFNVVIILRNPVQRIISHYYRFGREGPNKDKTFTDLSTQDLQTFLQSTGENLVVSYLTSSKITDFKSIADATKNAMANLQLCTVGIFEYWEETSHVLRYQNPWLQPPAFADSGTIQRELPSSLDPSVMGFLINRLVAEMRLYEFALKRFRREVKVVSENEGTIDANLPKLKIDPLFNPNNENYYRHFVPSPFPFA